jgi:hypothetical protein
LFGVHVPDAVAHPPLHSAIAGPSCGVQRRLVDLLPVRQVPAQVIEPEQRIGELPAGGEEVMRVGKRYGADQVLALYLQPVQRRREVGEHPSSAGRLSRTQQGGGL